jgi:hypothetical protein
MLYSHKTRERERKNKTKILEHLGHSPKQSMHTGDAEAIETVNEKHTTANLASTGSQIIIIVYGI